MTTYNRFERELQRMAGFRFAAIVIESTFGDFHTPPMFSRVHPRCAIRTLIGWSIKYGVPVYFADSRTHAASIVRDLYWRYRREGVIGNA